MYGLRELEQQARDAGKDLSRFTHLDAGDPRRIEAAGRNALAKAAYRLVKAIDEGFGRELTGEEAEYLCSVISSRVGGSDAT